MTLKEYKDVVQIHKLASNWIDDYTKENIGKQLPVLQKQYKEMCKIQHQTEQLIEKQFGDAGAHLDAGELQQKIQTLAKDSVAFSACFGDTKTPFDSTALVSKETVLLAIELKRLSSSWYGQFSDTANDNSTISLIASIHDQAKKLIAAPKTLNEDSMSLVFYGTKSDRCRKMRKTVERVQEEYEGFLDIEMHLVKDEDDSTHKLGIENFPSVVFKRGKETVAKHEGSLSISGIQQKVGILLSGYNFMDSSSVKSITEMKAVNQKELYNLGEHLVFYFEASWCGICKKATPVVQKFATAYHKVKFEQIQVDGSHSLHKSFGVNRIPAVVFVHDGKIIGKHTGYINPSNLERSLEQFAISNKKNMGFENYGPVSLINKDLVDPEENTRIKNKHASDEPEIA